MLHHHELTTNLSRSRLATGCLSLLAACAPEPLSDTDQALKALLLEEIQARMPPQVPLEFSHCLGILDTAYAPPPIQTLEDRDREFERLCASTREGRVRDLDPRMLALLRREFFLTEPDLRPLSHCEDKARPSEKQWDIIYQLIVERIEPLGPDEVAITLHERNLCEHHQRVETTWGRLFKCFMERKDGKWVAPNHCSSLSII